jgi:glutaredoxin
MSFEFPLETGFTIYSKTGCPNCKNVKDLLITESEVFNIVDCDEYLIEEKDSFLFFIEKLVGKEYKFFPMVFHNGNFIGGFSDTKNYLIYNK